MPRPVPTLKSLTLHRKKIERIDMQLIGLLHARFVLTSTIQHIKDSLRIARNQKKRELLLLERYHAKAKRLGLPNSLIQKFFRLIFSYAKKFDILKRWNRKQNQ